MPGQPIKHTDFADQDYWSLARALQDISDHQVESITRALAQLGDRHNEEAEQLRDELVGGLSELHLALKELTSMLDKNLSRIADHLYEISRPR
jgi:hypothetical protein